MYFILEFKLKQEKFLSCNLLYIHNQLFIIIIIIIIIIISIVIIIIIIIIIFEFRDWFT